MKAGLLIQLLVALLPHTMGSIQLFMQSMYIRNGLDWFEPDRLPDHTRSNYTPEDYSLLYHENLGNTVTLIINTIVTIICNYQVALPCSMEIVYPDELVSLWISAGYLNCILWCVKP